MQKPSDMMLPMEVQVPPCSRFAPACYQASASWQQWSRPQQHPGQFASDDNDDARLAPPGNSIGAPPGLEDIGPANLVLDAPCVPITPPPLPWPCYVTPSQKLVEAMTPLRFDLEADQATADSDGGDSTGSFPGGELFPHRLFNDSSEEATAVWNQLPEESASLLSKGSSKHDQGKCMPCHFFQRKQGCANGTNCRFCHLHDEMRNRPDKRKRVKARRAVDEWEQMEGGSQTKGEMAAKLATKDSYTKMLLERRLRDMDDEVQLSFQRAVVEDIDHFAEFS